MRAQDHPFLRRQRVQRHLDLRHKGKRPLTAAEQFAEVDGRGAAHGGRAKGRRIRTCRAIQPQRLVDCVAATAAAQRPVRKIRLYEAPDRRVSAPALELRINAPLEDPLSPLISIEERSVRQQTLDLQHMMTGGSIDERMCSARIVPDHPADTATVARRCLRAEKKPVRLQRDVQLIAHDARLDAGPAPVGIDFQYMVEMPADIHDNTIANHLPGNGRAPRAGNEASAPLPRDVDQLSDILHALRVRHPARDLPVRAGIGRIGYLVYGVCVNLHMLLQT